MDDFLNNLVIAIATHTHTYNVSREMTSSVNFGRQLLNTQSLPCDRRIKATLLELFDCVIVIYTFILIIIKAQM